MSYHGQDIKTRRLALGLSQRRLAELAKVSGSQLSRIEAGIQEGKETTLAALERALSHAEQRDAPVREDPTRVAARAAYRMGLLEAMLHPDTIAALKPPGIIVESMRGELTWRQVELSSVGITVEDLDDLRLETDTQAQRNRAARMRKRRIARDAENAGRAGRKGAKR